jgi:hypothetical protein
MNKEEFLIDKQVAAFVRFLADVISGGVIIDHHYIDRKKKCEFKFNTLLDAFEKYHWSGKGYEENALRLDVLTSKIKNANDDEFYQVCLDILFWGNGDREGGLYTHNKRWIDEVKSATGIKGVYDLSLDHRFWRSMPSSSISFAIISPCTRS